MGRIDQVRDFQNFKFDTEPSFNEWLKTLEITNDSPATQLRLRGKWYKKTIDVNFDLAWLAGLSTEQTTSSARSSQPSYTAPPPPQAQRPSAGASYAPPPSQAADGRGAYPVGTRVELYIFMYHVLILILAVLHLVPLLPTLSARSYKMFMQLAIVGQALKLFTTYSPSALRPFSLANAQRYLATIAPTSEFHFLIVAVAFSNHTPIALAMFPLAIPALYSVMARLNATHGQHALWQRFGAKAYQVLQSKQRETQMMAAWSELAVGAVLILTLFTRNRNIMLTFAYANLLKMRYHLGDCAAQHRAAWATVGQKTAGIRARAPPVVNQLLQYPINWFMSVR